MAQAHDVNGANACGWGGAPIGQSNTVDITINIHDDELQSSPILKRSTLIHFSGYFRDLLSGHPLKSQIRECTLSFVDNDTLTQFYYWVQKGELLHSSMLRDYGSDQYEARVSLVWLLAERLRAPMLQNHCADCLYATVLKRHRSGEALGFASEIANIWQSTTPSSKLRSLIAWAYASSHRTCWRINRSTDLPQNLCIMILDRVHDHKESSWAFHEHLGVRGVCEKIAITAPMDIFREITIKRQASPTPARTSRSNILAAMRSQDDGNRSQSNRVPAKRIRMSVEEESDSSSSDYQTEL